MDKEREAQLRKKLEEGVQISNLFPCMYRGGKKVYYEIHCPERQIKVILVIERKMSPASKQEETKFKIMEIYHFVKYKKQTLESELMYKHLIFKPHYAFCGMHTETNPMCLNGILYLEPIENKKEVL